MASPCETCDKGASCISLPCAAWTASFPERWQRISNYAASIRCRPTTQLPSPCDSCPSAEYCTVPCPDRLAHWDAQMAIIRKQVGV